MLFDISKASIEELHDDLFLQKQVRLSVLRLDKIHPLVSGNKIFKLQYFLEEALQATPAAGYSGKSILTFGGAYSNHLAATAFACKALHLKCIGIVRGEKPVSLSTTLLQCMEDGMHLKFISRAAYDSKQSPSFLYTLQMEYPHCVIVPAGGFHPLGAKGASLIYDLVKDKNFTHICMATGTATTLAGILSVADAGQYVVAVPVLKGITDIAENIKLLTGTQHDYTNLKIFDEYHFGGYAKKTTALTSFMNHCWLQYHLPLDFVYTAKMMFGIMDGIKKERFEKGSNIICLHTGGLQGNKSLPLNTLLY